MCIPIEREADIVVARREGRSLATQLGFSSGEAAAIATAISEIARNMMSYAGRGELSLRVVEEGTRKGLEVQARDQGPGIPDVEMAMQDGFSTSGGLGLGLPGARRLMEQFEVESMPGAGTTITMRKWTRHGAALRFTAR